MEWLLAASSPSDTGVPNDDEPSPTCRMTEDMQGAEPVTSDAREVLTFSKFPCSPGISTDPQRSWGPRSLSSWDYQLYLTDQEEAGCAARLRSLSRRFTISVPALPSNGGGISTHGRAEPQEASRLADHSQCWKRWCIFSAVWHQRQAADHPDHLLRSRGLRIQRGCSPDAERHRPTAHGHPYRSGQGAEGTAM